MLGGVVSWDSKLLMDELIFELVNLGYRAHYVLKGGGSGFGTTKNVELKDRHLGERCFVVGNGPSINSQNLRLLKDEMTFFVNRAFLLPDYEYIKPTYHIFIDPKLKTGEWVSVNTP